MTINNAKDLLCNLINASGKGTISRLYNQTGGERNEMFLGDQPGNPYVRVTVEDILPQECSAPCDVRYEYYVKVNFNDGQRWTKFLDTKLPLSEDQLREALKKPTGFYNEVGVKIIDLKVEITRVIEINLPSLESD